VKYWATFNEPQIFIGHGYEYGVHAPGRKEGRRAIYQAIHHVLVAHGLGMKLIRQYAPQAQAGIAMAPAGVWPASSSPADLEASERHWEFSNDWWNLPILEGRYPSRVLSWLGDEAPLIAQGDMELIGQGLDFMGLNYYVPARTQADPGDPRGFKGAPAPEDAPRPDFPGWEIFAPGLENLIVQFGRHYPGLDLYVTENGTSLYADKPGDDGRVADPRRIDFLSRHIAACERAIARGARLKGYYVWSFMDNFEWALGYKPRFGLVHVDYQSFKRSPKDSYFWYQSLARQNAFEFPGADPCPDFDFGPKTAAGKS
jgi:beta-glucosidase